MKPGGLITDADLAPTIVDAANEKAGLAMDGRSLLPVAQKPSIDRDRELLVEEPGFSAIRTERYLYAEYETGEKELYDLKNDPSGSKVSTPTPPGPRFRACSRIGSTASKAAPARAVASSSPTPSPLISRTNPR